MSLPEAREVVRPNQPSKTRNEPGLITLSDATDKIRHTSGAMDSLDGRLVRTVNKLAIDVQACIERCRSLIFRGVPLVRENLGHAE
jgi:hypothetical protein